MSSYADRLKKGVNYGEVGQKETFDSKRSLNMKLKKILKIIEKSQYIVVFTGAGISTSSGISDFRGEKNGIWTLEKKGIKVEKDKIDIENALPSFTHMAIVSLLKNDKIKYVISQNIDGLHIKSGIPKEKLSELHGNITKEVCKKCKKEYYRDFDVGTISFQKTGRNCECGEPLYDTLLDWDDELPEDEMNNAQDQLEKSDLIICLGTSLRVQPANELPFITLENKEGKMIICTLQKTPIDEYAVVKINCYVDDLMKYIIQELQIEIPIYKLDLNIKLTSKNEILFIEFDKKRLIKFVKMNQEIYNEFPIEIKDQDIEIEIHLVNKNEIYHISHKKNESKDYIYNYLELNYNQKRKNEFI